MPANLPPHWPLLALILFLIFGGIVGAWGWVLAQVASGRPLLPRRPTRHVPWDARSVLAVVIAWLFLNLSAQAVLVLIHGRREEYPLVDMMAVLSLFNLLLLVVIPWLLARLSQARPSDFGWDARTIGPDFRAGVVVGLCSLPFVYAIQLVVVQVWPPTEHPLQTMLAEDASLPVAALAILLAVVLAPIVEELIFRGVLQGWLEKVLQSRDVETKDHDAEPAGLPFELSASVERGRPGASDPQTPNPWRPDPAEPSFRPAPQGVQWARTLPILVSSVLFAGAHFAQWPAPIPLFLLAIGLGILYQRTGGIIAPVAMHATFNGVSSILMFVALQLGALEDSPIIPDPAAMPGDHVEGPLLDDPENRP